MNAVKVLGFLVVDTTWALFNSPHVVVAARALLQAGEQALSLHHSVTMTCGAFISWIVTAGCWLSVVAQT